MDALVVSVESLDSCFKALPNGRPVRLQFLSFRSRIRFGRESLPT